MTMRLFTYLFGTDTNPSAWSFLEFLEIGMFNKLNASQIQF